AQILAGLAPGAATPGAIAARIYSDIPAELMAAATRNVLAHLIDLSDKNLTVPKDGHGIASLYSRK
ncbi:MAG: MBL fold metallo-hydrolase, partial [Paracoccaceae bacterium]